jgi:hypothetical protein
MRKSAPIDLSEYREQAVTYYLPTLTVMRFSVVVLTESDNILLMVNAVFG